MKPVINRVTRLTTAAVLPEAVRLTLDDLCNAVNLLTSEAAPAEEPVEETEKVEEVEETEKVEEPVKETENE
jgi:hypothetical protein